MTTTPNNAAPPPYCPSCGHNLAAEQPVTIGPLEFEPRGEARWHGRKIPLTCGQFLIFGALVLAGGRYVSRDILAERAGYDGLGDAHNSVDVLTCRARRALRLVGCPTTIIRNERGRGLRLDVELLAELAKESGK
jgi:DNA-binding response OmpR family regulator